MWNCNEEKLWIQLNKTILNNNLVVNEYKKYVPKLIIMYTIIITTLVQQTHIPNKLPSTNAFI